MLNIERALNNDRVLRSLTGLNLKAFETLLVDFDRAYEKTLWNKPRKRAVGGGRKAQLQSSKSKLFFILFYFKCYPTFDIAGIVFDFDRAQAHEWMHRLQGILEQVLGEKMVLPERKIRSMAEFVERFPDITELKIDGTERATTRPKDPELQKKNYSGKKKRHTRKHIAAVDQKKRVVVLTKAREGKLHDKRFHDEDNIAEHIPDDSDQEGMMQSLD